MATQQVIKAANMPTIRLLSTKAAPALPLATGHTWHMFLSHTWGTGQDQCATIKRQLCLLLPDASIFLDVDDLESIDELEVYVDATAVIMIFLSGGYFKSGNCLREARCTLEKKKPIVLMHDPNGAALETIKADECPEDMLGPIFKHRDAWREVIEWHRIKDFQIISLKLLAHQLLIGCPSDKGTRNRHLGTDTDRQRHEDSRGIFLPGEISRIKLAFPAPVLLFVSTNNPGASETAALLQEGMVGLSVTSVTPTRWRRGYLAKGIGQLFGSGSKLLTDLVGARDSSLGDAVEASAAGTVSGEPNNVTHMLLYLNDETFVGPEGAALANEARAALNPGPGPCPDLSPSASRSPSPSPSPSLST